VLKSHHYLMAGRMLAAHKYPAWTADGWDIITAIAVPMLPNCARVVRSTALTVRQMPLMDAARATESGIHVLFYATCFAR
jgi:ABC-type dipeptide/oligopeptide/nickel transport system permease subunit